MLDDGGRYTFTVGGPGLSEVPDDYSAGETDCAVLAAPPVVDSASAAVEAGHLRVRPARRGPLASDHAGLDLPV